MALVTCHLLQNGIQGHYPNTNPDTWTETRFFVYLKDYGSSIYMIVDDDLDLKVEIELSLLENPKFNLIFWYQARANTVGKFSNRYLKNQRKAYQPMLKNTCARPVAPCICNCGPNTAAVELTILRNVSRILEQCKPYPGDENTSSYHF